ncbi:bifunctional AP-4-A phosphorylase/ADP sulfurylase [Thecaphora frezii]
MRLGLLPRIVPSLSRPLLAAASRPPSRLIVRPRPLSKTLTIRPMSSSTDVPTDVELRSLPSRVKKQYEKALEAGDAFFYPSDKIVVLRDSLPSGEDGTQVGSSVDWQVRIVPALLKKPKSNLDKEKEGKENLLEEEEGQKKGDDKPEQNKDDVFAPPYVPNLLVQELGDHVILLNKFCVVPQHFLMVTREFETQNLPPSPATLALAYRIITAQRSSETELLGFYNCGQVSGASQPHRHLQFIQVPTLDLGKEGHDDAEIEAILDSDVKVPVEALLDRIERDGKELDHVHALPLPWQHFVALLQPEKETRADADKLERYIGNKFMGLLDALFRARTFAASAEGQDGVPSKAAMQSRRGPPSFNILLTKRAMHVIPRSQEEYQDLPKDPEGKVGNLSINSLGYAGFMLTKSLEELEALRKVDGGIPTVLAQTGVAPLPDVTVSGGLPTSH